MTHQTRCLIVTYRTFCSKAAEYTFFLIVHETFFRMNHMLGHKISFNKFKNTEIIPNIFSDQNDMKLEINYKKKKTDKQKKHVEIEQDAIEQVNISKGEF